jgi:hypothetical protein
VSLEFLNFLYLLVWFLFWYYVVPRGFSGVLTFGSDVMYVVVSVCASFG